MNIGLSSKISKKRVQKIIEYYRYLVPYSIVNHFRKLEKESIISIFSSPRGGSTWLAKILGQIPDSCLVWEPLFRHPPVSYKQINPYSYSEPVKLGVWWNQFVALNDDWPELENFFYRLFNREIVNLKLYQYNNLKNVPHSKYFIFKFCFGNLILPWLVKRFNIKAIFLVRHPCAVVASQYNHGAFQNLISNPKFEIPHWVRNKDYYLPFQRVVQNTNSSESYLAVRWAMNNSYLLNHSGNNTSWLTVSYESLLLNTEYELDRIRNWIGNDTIFNIDKVKEASFTSHKQYINKNFQSSNWKTNLSKHQIENIISVVRECGIDSYGDDIMPDLEAIYCRHDRPDYYEFF